MSSKDKERILYPHIILCEGMDEWSFFVNYLSYLIKEDEVFNSIQVIDFGGITDLKKQFRQLIKMPGFSMVKSILIVRDAETSPQGAKDSICSTLNNNGYRSPNKSGEIVMGSDNVMIAYMLFPSCDEKGNEAGTLEDLCLRIISEPNHDNVLNEIDDYLSVMKSKYSMNYPRIHKNKLHMLISSYDKYVGAKVGEAGQRGLYNWHSEHLSKMRDIMYKLCLGNQ